MSIRCIFVEIRRVEVLRQFLAYMLIRLLRFVLPQIQCSDVVVLTKGYRMVYRTS
jgi:hypothetical protein